MSSAAVRRLTNARGAVKPPHWSALMVLCKVLFILTLCFGPGACMCGFLRCGLSGLSGDTHGDRFRPQHLCQGLTSHSPFHPIAPPTTPATSATSSSVDSGCVVKSGSRWACAASPHPHAHTNTNTRRPALGLLLPPPPPLPIHTQALASSHVSSPLE